MIGKFPEIYENVPEILRTSAAKGGTPGVTNNQSGTL
jgi:hypothetical protein